MVRLLLGVMFVIMSSNQTETKTSKLRAGALFLWRWLKNLGWWRIALIVVGLVAIFLIRDYRQQKIDAELVARVSFAKMWDRLDEIESVQYTEIESYPDSSSNSYRRKIAILGKGLRRSEDSRDKSFLKLAAHSIESRLRGYAGSPGISIFINDDVNGKMVTLNVEKKLFAEYTHYVTKDQTGKVISKKAMEPNLGVNRLSSFRNLMFFKEAKQIGVKTVDGIRAVGFAAEGDWSPGVSSEEVAKQKDYHRYEEYWIDPDTQLPVKVDIRLFPKKAGVGGQCWQMTDIVFDDTNLDESLFDTAPPAGYKSEKKMIETVVNTPQPKTKKDAASTQ